MKTVGAFEAKTHLSALLDDVSRGERVTITKHGRVVAMLVPPEARHKPSDAAAKLLELRAGKKLNGELRELIDEGRA